QESTKPANEPALRPKGPCSVPSLARLPAAMTKRSDYAGRRQTMECTAVSSARLADCHRQEKSTDCRPTVRQVESCRQPLVAEPMDSGWETELFVLSGEHQNHLLERVKALSAYL